MILAYIFAFKSWTQNYSSNRSWLKAKFFLSCSLILFHLTSLSNIEVFFNLKNISEIQGDLSFHLVDEETEGQTHSSMTLNYMRIWKKEQVEEQWLLFLTPEPVSGNAIFSFSPKLVFFCLGHLTRNVWQKWIVWLRCSNCHRNWFWCLWGILQLNPEGILIK